MSTLVLGAGILVLALVMAAGARAASPGSPDSSFGAGGIAGAGAGTRLFGTAVQSNGDVVAVGVSGAGTADNLLLERFTPAGALDSSFGSGGIVFGPPTAGTLGATGSLGRAVAIQPNGQIVVVGKATSADGSATNGLLVERFNANGSLDSSFGSGGVVDVGPTSFGDGYGVAVQPDGKIVATGSLDAPGSGGGTYPRATVVRLNANGSLDSSFTGGGVDVIDLGAFSYAVAVALQPNGDIVFAGSQAPGLQVPNALIARLTPSGAPDAGFASGGAYAHQYAQGAASSGFSALALQSNGDIVAAGNAASGNTGAATLVVRFTSAGAQDGSFGSGGAVYATSAVGLIQTASASIPGASGVTITPNGDIVAAGTFVNGLTTYGTLWAFTPSGAADGSFGTGGTAVLNTGSGNTEYAALALSPTTGDLVSAGDSGSTFGGAYAGIVTEYGGFGAPIPPPPPPPPAFAFSLNALAGSYKTSTVARHGLKVAATCNQACTTKLSLVLSAGTARRLRILTQLKRCRKVNGRERCVNVRRCRKVNGRERCVNAKGYRAVTIATGKGSRTAAGTVTTTLRLKRAYIRTLEREKRNVSVSLQVTGTSTVTHKTKTIKKSLTFKR